MGDTNDSEAFKKPVFIAPPKKQTRPTPEIEQDQPDSTSNLGVNSSTEKPPPIPYQEPEWSAIPSSESGYKLEVLKDGSIIHTIHLKNQSRWLFGRLPVCDVPLQHPTISRFHAVLQYRALPKSSSGFYIYDLGSTHGTFLNKNKLVAKVFAPVRVGHMIKMGGSTRSYILNGPDDDAELESEFTVTELKQQRAQELRQREEEIERLKREEETAGIDWGLGEDADESTDLSVNPFAETTNEALYIDDPKKALRGYFEREGLDLEYDCTEQGMGQFLCKVELPLDDVDGRPLRAEVLHKGKKKEAVVQCALEACRILDRYGMLRRAKHESKKRKAKNWAENDYYDSDEDTFLDRTGSVERKRENRMKTKQSTKVETYDSLSERVQQITKEIHDLETMIEEMQKLAEREQVDDTEADPLDSFMSQLNDKKTDKQTITRLKNKLKQLKLERENTARLVNIAKPTSMPALVVEDTSSSSKTNKVMPMFGKRMKIKVDIPAKPSQAVEIPSATEGEEVEEDDVEEPVSSVVEEQTRKNEEKPGEVQTSSIEENKPASKTERRKDDVKPIKSKKKQVNHELKAKYGDMQSDEYEMWVPPSGQSGDGRTSLNDKLGY